MILKAYFINMYPRYMEHHTLPVISGLLLLTSAPLGYSVSVPPYWQPQPNTFYYNCYYIFWAQRKKALAICVNKLLKIYVSKIVLNVLFIVEVFENKYCIVLYAVVVDANIGGIY